MSAIEEEYKSVLKFAYKVNQDLDSINQDDSVIVIDDLVATGGTADAAAKLIDISKGKVAGFIFVINLFDLGGCDNLKKKNYKVENLIEFPGH